MELQASRMRCNALELENMELRIENDNLKQMATSNEVNLYAIM